MQYCANRLGNHYWKYDRLSKFDECPTSDEGIIGQLTHPRIRNFEESIKKIPSFPVFNCYHIIFSLGDCQFLHPERKQPLRLPLRSSELPVREA